LVSFVIFRDECNKALVSHNQKQLESYLEWNKTKSFPNQKT